MKGGVVVGERWWVCVKGGVVVGVRWRVCEGRGCGWSEVESV